MKHKWSRALIWPRLLIDLCFVVRPNGAALYMSSGMAPPPAPFQSSDICCSSRSYEEQEDEVLCPQNCLHCGKVCQPASNLPSTRTPRLVQEQTGGEKHIKSQNLPRHSSRPIKAYPFPRTRIPSKPANAARHCSKVLFFARRSHISITSAFLSASSMRVGWVRMATFSRTNP
jgi:hypothetical protein